MFRFNDSYSDDEFPSPKKIHNKSNSINTLGKFYNPCVEFVHTLNFRNILYNKEMKQRPKNLSLMEKKVLKEDKLSKGKKVFKKSQAQQANAKFVC